MAPRQLFSLLAALAALALAGCPLGVCPDDSEVAWEDVEPIFTAHCTRCHDSARTGGERAGAPEGIDFDNPEAALVGASLSWTKVRAGTMPPSGALDEADQELLREWWACEGPE